VQFPEPKPEFQIRCNQVRAQVDCCFPYAGWQVSFVQCELPLVIFVLFCFS
jgi:hypothetical protein